MRFKGTAALCAVLLAALSCSSEDSGEGTDTGAPSPDVSDSGSESSTDVAVQQDTTSGDTAAPDTGGVDAVDAVEADVDPCAACGTGLCVDGACVECVGNENCTPPTWCRDMECVQTLCVGETVQCSEAGVPQRCAADGEAWLDQQPCSEEETCVAGSCVPVTCEPGDTYCASLTLFQCNPNGAGYVPVGCPPGTACFPGNDQCTAIRPNVLLVFDTSGSMGSVGFLESVPCICGPGQCPATPYPACEDTSCPRSALGLAKKVMLDLFSSPAFSGVRFAMTRFPQRVSVKKNPSCNDLIAVGNYIATSGDRITGDGGWHVAPENGYFEQNLSEILCVPFPETSDFDSYAAAVSWVDSDEKFETYEKSCTKSAECYPDVCALDDATQTGSCGKHTNPELRATGNTPLGKSLFYAGEYLRKYVVIDGKPCAQDADCKNVNYFCSPEGKCYDPLKSCRPNIVVLFTDGAETEFVETTEFFNPRVQAKRLHYGLGCAFDSDCLNGAKCKSARCTDYEMPNSGNFEYIGYIDGEGANRVTAYDGSPISATVHVVDIGSGEAQNDNRLTADHGGGVFYPVNAGDPDKLLEAFESVLDLKENIKKCVPEVPE